MIVGCYSLHLYCDDPAHTHKDTVEIVPPDERQRRYRLFLHYTPGEFGGRSESQALRTAVAHGWRIRRRSRSKPRGFALCPIHNKARTKPLPDV